MTSSKSKWKRAVTVVLGGAAALVGIALARTAQRAAADVRPVKHAIDAAARASAFRDVPDLRDVSFRTSDGLTLRGWFSPGTRGVVILVHGGEGDRTQLFPTARVLARHGYGFLAYDSRASGESDGDEVTWGDEERRDVTAALDFVAAQPAIDPRRVALYGFSMGASSVALVAAKDTRARAVILSPVWTCLADEMGARAGRLGPLSVAVALAVLRRKGIDVDAVRPIDHVAEIAPRPIFFITGTGDTDTPVSMVRRVYDAAGQPKEWWVVPGARHGKYLEAAPAEYESRIIGFLDGALPR
ncbi:MAG TPA: alpha/beta fold hydrolase [Polyangiaceae bacterium]|jgi:dipeptidyl aminopeptidase/acylaminoacyl peptidase